MSQALVVFGICYIVVMAAVILVPYFRRRADLLTAWNLYLLGSINFIGIGAIYSGLTVHHVGTFDDDDRFRFLVGAIAYHLALFAAYYLWKYPRRAAGRRLRKWPPLTPIT